MFSAINVRNVYEVAQLPDKVIRPNRANCMEHFNSIRFIQLLMREKRARKDLPYPFKQALLNGIRALENERRMLKKYCWRPIYKDKDDVPDDDRVVQVAVVCNNEFYYFEAFYDKDLQRFCDIQGHYIRCVIAWREVLSEGKEFIETAWKEFCEKNGGCRHPL